MKILADRHHEALWNSLVFLLEDRLGHELHHPWGLEWFPEYWKIAEPYNNDIATARQFLEGKTPNDGTQKLRPTRGVTFEDFINTGNQFDAIIASYYPHIDVYSRLINIYKPTAKLIVHYGNEWPFHPDTRNFMCSTAPMAIPPSINSVFYYQEFDDVQVFAPTEGEIYPMVASMVNALPVNSIFRENWMDYLEFETALDDSDIGVRAYGGGCPDGSLSYPDEVAKVMKHAAYGFHLKAGGDGFGHVIHNWAAVGRPVIFRSSQYKGKLAEPLLEHGQTGIDLDKMSVKDAAWSVKTDIESGLHTGNAMGEEIRERYEELVDFDKEAEKVQQFLERLI